MSLRIRMVDSGSHMEPVWWDCEDGLDVWTPMSPTALARLMTLASSLTRDPRDRKVYEVVTQPGVPLSFTEMDVMVKAPPLVLTGSVLRQEAAMLSHRIPNLYRIQIVHHHQVGLDWEELAGE